MYLTTICPTIFHNDSPEIVNTAFALGISHPAGFPAYNLLAKGLTFIPLGSVAFKVNLFSTLAACLTLVFLYLTGIRFLQILFGPEKYEKYFWASLLPAGYLAFCRPFWDNANQAEVYTLHALFTCVIFWLLLSWRVKSDVRYLFGAALAYGLSAGNHATVAFYLPAILILFFCWNRENILRNLSMCVVFFLVGLSVYAYLPIRSFAEPSFDWGNPETLNGFLYQVTDRKDASDHFLPIIANTPLQPEVNDISSAITAAFISVKNYLNSIRKIAKFTFIDLQNNMSYVSFIGFLVGAALCLWKSLPLFLFFLTVAGFNVTFFYFWGNESYFPTYVVASVFTAAMIYFVITRMEEARKKFLSAGPLRDVNFPRIALIVLALLIPWGAALNFAKVDRSGNYVADSLYKRIYLTLENRAIFIPGLSWFHYYYYQDISRLRDDVTAINVWDLLSPNPPSMLTPRRFPKLYLPDPSIYNFNSKENISDYVRDFMEGNSARRPILLEQCMTLYEQTLLTESFIPYRNVLLKYAPGHLTEGLSPIERPVFDEYKLFLQDEIEKMKKEGTAEKKWISAPAFILKSFAMYYHDTRQYAREREVLEIIFNFLGKKYAAVWNFKLLDNFLLDNDLQKAERVRDDMHLNFPGQYDTWVGEGLTQRARGEVLASLISFQKAADMRPAEFRPRLEMGVSHWLNADKINALRELNAARERVVNLRQLKMIRTSRPFPN